MTRRLQKAVDCAFGDLSKDERNHLCRSAQKGFSEADTAAVVLGLDLWRDENAAWRECFEREPERPSIWRFRFGPCARWNAALWRALCLSLLPFGVACRAAGEVHITAAKSRMLVFCATRVSDVNLFQACAVVDAARD